VLAACSDDDDDTDVAEGQDTAQTVVAGPDDTSEEGTDAPPATATDGTATGDTAGTATEESCDAYAAVSTEMVTGSPDTLPAAFDDLLAVMPEQFLGQAEIVADGFAASLAGDGEAMLDPMFVTALGYVGGYFVDNCALDAKVEIVGEDYTFTGLPAEIDAGRVGIRLVNGSASGDAHELIVLRRPDGDTRTAAEIAALDLESVYAEYEMVGVAFAEVPAAMMSIVVDLEAGEYVAICNLPVDGDGTTSHAHEGMVMAFTAS